MLALHGRLNEFLYSNTYYRVLVRGYLWYLLCRDQFLDQTEVQEMEKEVRSILTLLILSGCGTLSLIPTAIDKSTETIVETTQAIQHLREATVEQVTELHKAEEELKELKKEVKAISKIPQQIKEKKANRIRTKIKKCIKDYLGRCKHERDDN